MLTMLMYHRILLQEHPEAVSVPMFRRQLDYLQRHYQILAPEEVLDYVHGKLRDAPRPYAALSFDDGWLDNWLFATEILKARGLRATLAMSAGYLHEGALRKTESDEILNLRMAEAQKRAAAGDLHSYVNISELKAMQDSGVWRIEAHGTRHVKGSLGVSALAMPQDGEPAEAFREMLKEDIGGCCKKLEAITGCKPQMFFWPWGHYTADALDAVSELGLIQFTVAKGTIQAGDNRKVLPRLGVSPRWKKFRKNCFVFRHPLLAAIHDMFHTERVCFDGFRGDSK